MIIHGFIPFSLIIMVLGVDFSPFVRVSDRTVDGILSSFPAGLSVVCIQQCGVTPSCLSATYSEASGTCFLHDKHPVHEDTILTASQGNTLYYSLDCPSDWHTYNGKCYRFTSNALSWHGSRDYCLSIGGNLVKIETAEEQTFLETVIYGYYTAYGHFWIGGYFNQGIGDFVWYDNTAITYGGWGGGNPNIFTGCVDLSAPIGYKWNDHHDCSEAINMICEKDIIIQ